jgi:hypothetical protein
MNTFYNLIDSIKEKIEQSDFNNQVTFGDITEVDLGKLTNFPLAHIMVDSATIEDRTISYGVKLLVCDVVDVNKEYATDNQFLGNSNVQDILNTQFSVLNGLVAMLKRLDLVDNNFLRIDSTVSATPFRDRFENELAGWETDLTIVSKNDVSIC